MNQFVRLFYDTGGPGGPASPPDSLGTLTPTVMNTYGGSTSRGGGFRVPPEVWAKLADLASVTYTNQSSKDWQEMMYGRQRNDALADWEMMNRYNSPAEQMMRLKSAGLNPNLAYGSIGNASGSVRPSTAGNWKPEVPNVGAIGDAMFAREQFSVDTRVKEAQVDNLDAMRNLNIQNALLKAADVANKTVDTDTKKYNLQYKKDIRDLSIEAIDWQNRKLMADTSKSWTDVGVGEARRKEIFSVIDKNVLDLAKIAADTRFTIDANTRAWIMNSVNVNEGLARIQETWAKYGLTRDQREEVAQKISELRSSGQLKNAEQQAKVLDSGGSNGSKELIGFLLGTILRKGK